MLAIALIYDLARSAEKMAGWNCIGNDNVAWKEGPYISSPQGEDEINHSHPYCFRPSDIFGVIAGMVMRGSLELSGGEKQKLPLPPKDKHESRVEPAVAKLAIIEQFEYFKEFLMQFDGPYNKKNNKAWVGRVDENVLKEISDLTDRRNQLIHDTEYETPSMGEALSYFDALRRNAQVLYIRIWWASGFNG